MPRADGRSLVCGVPGANFANRHRALRKINRLSGMANRHMVIPLCLPDDLPNSLMKPGRTRVMSSSFDNRLFCHLMPCDRSICSSKTIQEHKAMIPLPGSDLSRFLALFLRVELAIPASIFPPGVIPDLPIFLSITFPAFQDTGPDRWPFTDRIRMNIGPGISLSFATPFAGNNIRSGSDYWKESHIPMPRNQYTAVRNSAFI